MTKLLSLARFFILSVCLLAAAAHAAGTNTIRLTGDQPFDAFADKTVTEAMEKYRIPGLVLTVVDGEGIILLKGYGAARLVPHEAVDPSRHLFRLGSVTKNFTSIALLLLADRGEIDLNADVNKYLKSITVPAGYGEPIRVRDLLAHRPGFEDRWRDLFAMEPEQARSLKDWLQAWPPKRVRPPGIAIAYSNYGVALAGQIIADVTGLSYPAFLQKEIFATLEMTSTTAREPLGRGDDDMLADLAARRVQAYFATDEGFIEAPYEFISPVAPAGVISSTGNDMARWLNFLLTNMTPKGVPLLSDKMFAGLADEAYPDRDGGPGYANTFRRGSLSGYRTLEHAGATRSSFAQSIIVPDRGVGAFIAVNGAATPFAPYILSRTLLGALIGEARSAPNKIDPLSESDAANYTGRYFTNRRSYSSFEKFVDAFNGIRDVSRTTEGYLSVPTPLGQDVYARLNPRVFRQVDGEERVVFDLDENGRAIRYTGFYGNVSNDRMSVASDPDLLVIAAGIAGLLCIAGLFAAWPRRGSNNTPLLPHGRIAIFFTVGATCLLLAAAAMVEWQVSARSPTADFSYPTLSMTILSTLATLYLLVPTALFASTVVTVRTGNARNWRFAILSVLFLATLALTIEMVIWNLPGWQF